MNCHNNGYNNERRSLGATFSWIIKNALLCRKALNAFCWEGTWCVCVCVCARARARSRVRGRV